MNNVLLRPRCYKAAFMPPLCSQRKQLNFPKQYIAFLGFVQQISEKIMEKSAVY